MKKIIPLFLVLAILYLVGCTTVIDEQSTELSIINDASTFEKIQVKSYSNDFDFETNNRVVLNEYEMELPHDWQYEFIDNDYGLYIYPTKELPPVFSFGVLNTKKEYDLFDNEEQYDLASSIVSAYANTINNCSMLHYEVSTTQLDAADGAKSDISVRYEMSIKCSATINDKLCNGTIIAFYLDDELYAFSLFEYENSKYTFYNDMKSIINTIKHIDVEIDLVDINSSEVVNEINDNDYGIFVSFINDHIENNKLNLKVFVKNEGAEIFYGKIFVSFFDDNHKILGMDTIIVEELYPGTEVFSNVAVDTYKGSPEMVVSFSDVYLSKIENNTSIIDDVITEKVLNDFYWNFYDVSWYNDVVKIEVYTDCTCIVTIKENSENQGLFYASTIWGCANDYGVNTVQVVNELGEIVAYNKYN